MSDCLNYPPDPNYPIIRKKKKDFFPLGGDRRSQTFVNDPCLPENRRRMRVDPLRDGWDPGEDPVRRARRRPNDSDIPIR